jgi:hypothetical protein
MILTKKIIRNNLEKFKFWIKINLKFKNKTIIKHFKKVSTLRFKKMSNIKDINIHKHKFNKAIQK